MKTALILISFLSLSVSLWAQGSKKEEQNLFKEKKVPKYFAEIESGKQLYLKMDYGHPEILNASDIKQIAGSQVASVDIVYSDHPKGADFSELTKNRIENLKKLNPSLLRKKNIQWNLVLQTDCPTKEVAKKLFHGIVITYRPFQGKKEMALEIKYLKELTAKITSAVADSVGLETMVEKELFYGDGYDSVGFSIGSSDLKLPTVLMPVAYPSVKDSTVLAVLNRNNWKNMNITADLTGSMSPYTGQLFVWLRLNTNNEKVKQFVFFNDGNWTRDSEKIIGKTGGIYHTKSAAFADVENLAFKTMSNGSGGDGPENDVESILKAIELCPECADVILIADNWAPVKDISLMSRIAKPVKIILCGADSGVNPQYLDLARATGGSVHTMREDLTELMKLNEGQEIIIRGQRYKIIKGKFVLLSGFSPKGVVVTKI